MAWKIRTDKKRVLTKEQQSTQLDANNQLAQEFEPRVWKNLVKNLQEFRQVSPRISNS